MAAVVAPFDYKGAEIRTVLIAGEPWFVLSDLCVALDITNARNVRTRLADDQKGVHRVDTLGGSQQMTICNESGMYEVVIRSDKPEAAAFRRWITSVVLPQIRKTGVYGTPKELTRLELIDIARAAELGRIAAEEKVAELTPKARTFDLFLGAGGDYSVGEAAKMLCRDEGIEIGERRLFAAMERLGWVYRDNRGRPIPYQTQVDLGRLVAKARWYTDADSGEQVATTPQVRVTPKGLETLRGKLRAA